MKVLRVILVPAKIRGRHPESASHELRLEPTCTFDVYFTPFLTHFTETSHLSVTRTEHKMFELATLQFAVQLSTKMCGTKIQHAFSETVRRSRDVRH